MSHHVARVAFNGDLREHPRVITKLKAAGLFGLALSLFAGCGGTAGNVCDRMEECGVLQVSVDECSDDLSSRIDSLAEGVASDCGSTLDGCLEDEVCEDFGRCLENDGVEDTCDFEIEVRN